MFNVDYVIVYLQWTDEDKDSIADYASQMFDNILTNVGLSKKYDKLLIR